MPPPSKPESRGEEVKRPPTSSQQAPGEERRRFQLVDGAYRIVFNKDKQQQYHAKVNIRDRSLDNIHGDANFVPPGRPEPPTIRRVPSRGGPNVDDDEPPPLEQVYRTPPRNPR